MQRAEAEVVGNPVKRVGRPVEDNVKSMSEFRTGDCLILKEGKGKMKS